MRSNTRNGLPRATAFLPSLAPATVLRFTGSVHRALRLSQHLLAVSQALVLSFSATPLAEIDVQTGKCQFPGRQSFEKTRCRFEDSIFCIFNCLAGARRSEAGRAFDRTACGGAGGLGQHPSVSALPDSPALDGPAITRLAFSVEFYCGWGGCGHPSVSSAAASSHGLCHL